MSERPQEIVLQVPPDRAIELFRKLMRLQESYGTRSLVETIERAVDEAEKRL